MGAFSPFKCSSFVIFWFKIRTKQSKSSPAKIDVMKNAAINKMEKNHFSHLWSIREFPPPMKVIKMSMNADRIPPRWRFSFRRMIERTNAAKLMKRVIKAATIWTASGINRIFIWRVKLVPYTNTIISFIEPCGYNEYVMVFFPLSPPEVNRNVSKCNAIEHFSLDLTL